MYNVHCTSLGHNQTIKAKSQKISEFLKDWNPFTKLKFQQLVSRVSEIINLYYHGNINIRTFLHINSISLVIWQSGNLVCKKVCPLGNKSPTESFHGRRAKCREKTENLWNASLFYKIYSLRKFVLSKHVDFLQIKSGGTTFCTNKHKTLRHFLRGLELGMREPREDGFPWRAREGSQKSNKCRTENWGFGNLPWKEEAETWDC